MYAWDVHISLCMASPSLLPPPQEDEVSRYQAMALSSEDKLYHENPTITQCVAPPSHSAVDHPAEYLQSSARDIG
jgi:hypothetical protein